jgi:hypothetical protein
VRGLPDIEALEILVEKLRNLMDRKIEGVSGIVNLSTDDEPLFMVQLTPSAHPQSVVDEIRRQVPTDE